MAKKTNFFKTPNGDLINANDIQAVKQHESKVILNGANNRFLHAIQAPDAETAVLYRDEIIQVVEAAEKGQKHLPNWK